MAEKFHYLITRSLVGILLIGTYGGLSYLNLLTPDQGNLIIGAALASLRGGT